MLQRRLHHKVPESEQILPTCNEEHRVIHDEMHHLMWDGVRGANCGLPMAQTCPVRSYSWPFLREPSAFAMHVVRRYGCHVVICC